MRHFILLSFAVLLLAGCASTVDSRKKERAAAYAQLTPEMKRLVDQGSIAVGMPMDAVYIAWGKPAQVLHSGDPSGTATTWLYEGAWLDETTGWAHRWVGGRHGPYVEGYVVPDYIARAYVSAEIVFVNGVVQSWRTLPQPTY